jgi:hypothetical protein
VLSDKAFFVACRTEKYNKGLIWPYNSNQFSYVDKDLVGCSVFRSAVYSIVRYLLWAVLGGKSGSQEPDEKVIQTLESLIMDVIHGACCIV